MIGYDIDNQYGGSGVPIQAFIFTMYDTVNKEYIPTYCSDINITAVKGANYRRLNLEDSSFAGSTAGQIRALSPTTGGIGTTIFTTLGILLVFAACALFIYKRRIMSI